MTEHFCTPWIIFPLLTGHSSLELFNWEAYYYTQGGRKEPNFSVVPIKFMTTTHRNDCNSTEPITVKYKLKQSTLKPLKSKSVAVWGTQIMCFWQNKEHLCL